MYLSLLKLNPRSRKAMKEVTRPYELHRSLMRAFLDEREGGPGCVLFRLDTDRERGALSLLVQSEKEPDWARLNGSGSLLLEPPEFKTFDPDVARGQVLYFRLRANPTVKRNGKRFGILREEDQVEWLKRKGSEGGFETVSVTVVPEGMARDRMTDDAGKGHGISLLSVRFEGVLKVVDRGKFLQILKRGVGSAKGFGFGLLSIAPIREG